MIEDHSWRVKTIKNLTIFYALKEAYHCYVAQHKRLFHVESFLLKSDPLKDEPLKGRSWKFELERLGCIFLKCEPLQWIFCLREKNLGNGQKVSLFNHLNSLQRHIKFHTSGFTDNNKVYCLHLVCGKGKLSLNGISHFKNHIALIHKISL